MRASKSSAYLNKNQLEVDYGPEVIQQQVANHRRFVKETIQTQVYRDNDGGEATYPSKTTYPLRNRIGIKVLNLRDCRSPEEMRRYKIDDTNSTQLSNCEIWTPGAFLSAGITLGDEQSTFGAVRALRLRESPRGPFTAQDEAILAHCCSVLATLMRSRVKTPIVISYSRATNRHRQTLCDVLEDIGYRPRFLEFSDDPGDLAKAFKQLVADCMEDSPNTLGIAILNGDEEVFRGDDPDSVRMPSSNVRAELETLLSSLGTERVLAVRSSEAQLPQSTTQDLTTVEYRRGPHSVESVIHLVIRRLKEMGDAAVSEMHKSSASADEDTESD